MGLKGTTGASLTLVKKEKNKNKVSCENCKHYAIKWCNGFNISCTSLSNAKMCKKYKNKYGKDKSTPKRSIKRRCNMCEHLFYGMVSSSNNKSKYGYVCRQTGKERSYDTNAACGRYIKKKTE